MEKIQMRLNIAKKGDYEVLAGHIKEIREGSGSAAGRVLNIKLAGTRYDKETSKEVEEVVDIAFWNSDDGQNMACDKVKSYGLKGGDFLSVLVVRKEDNKAIGFGCRFLGGSWSFRGAENSRELNIFIGTIANFKEDAKGRFVKFSIPSKVNGETIWRNITVWNNETADMATRAKK